MPLESNFTQVWSEFQDFPTHSPLQETPSRMFPLLFPSMPLLHNVFTPTESLKGLRSSTSSCIEHVSVNITYNQIYREMLLMCKFHFGEPSIKEIIVGTSGRLSWFGVCLRLRS